MKIKVEDYHIRAGECRSLEGCPVALAVTPRLPVGYFAIILEDEIRIRERVLPVNERIARERAVKLPAEVTERIMQYDKTAKMEPFEFDIELPGAEKAQK